MRRREWLVHRSGVRTRSGHLPTFESCHKRFFKLQVLSGTAADGHFTGQAARTQPVGHGDSLEKRREQRAVA